VFTGLVRELGRVLALERGPGRIRLVVEAPATAAGASVGDSIALNGCCLTAVDVTGDRLSFDVVPETLACTTLAALEEGQQLNVEPSLRVGEPLGGHLVQGHVDGVGHVRSTDPEGDGRRVWIDAPSEVARYCVAKGSVAVDGVSLTVAAVDAAGFAAALVPHTLAVTTLGSRKPGDAVNLEADVLAKYVERLIEKRL
jgi:riboflavin synthase